MNNSEDIWDQPSQLPLVAYFPGTVEPATRSGSDALAATAVAPIAELPHTVVSNVLHENYSRRAQEANDTARPLYDELFSDDHTLRDDEKSSVLDEYVRFRVADVELHAKFGKRVLLFLESNKPLHLNAYEIYARQCDAEEKFADLSFAASCFKRIVSHLNDSSVDYEADDTLRPSLPKLTRVAPYDGDRFAVVTSKVEIGNIDCGEDTYSLKSRKAGAFMISLIGDKQKEVIEMLHRYDRSRGRSEELLEARRALQSIIDSQPDLVRPVVESLYLTRRDTRKES